MGLQISDTENHEVEGKGVGLGWESGLMNQPSDVEKHNQHAICCVA